MSVHFRRHLISNSHNFVNEENSFTKLLNEEIQRQIALSTVLLVLGVTDMNTGKFRVMFRPRNGFVYNPD